MKMHSDVGDAQLLVTQLLELKLYQEPSQNSLTMAANLLGLVALVAVAMVAFMVEARNFGAMYKPMEVDFSGYCSDESIPSGSSYWTSLNQTFTDLIQNTANANNMSYSVKNGGDGVSAFGQAQCFRLSRDSCKSCVTDMIRRAWQECGDAIAGMLMLKDKCTIRYQDSPLL